LLTMVFTGRAHAQGRPMIEHIEPTSGPPGTRVTIVGRGFRSNLRVLFNDHEVPTVERLPERVVVVLPANPRSGRFVVAHGADEVESEVFRVTEAPPAPLVTAIDPPQAGPGMEVVIRGTNFAARTSDNEVRIGALSMVVRAADPNALRVIVPDGAQTGPMTVHTPGGDVQTPPLNVSARVLVRDFAPTAAAPGGNVVIRGSGFSTTLANNHITLGGRTVRVVRATSSEVEFQVPNDAQQGGSIVVEVPGAGRFETGAALRVAPAPLVREVVPPQGAPGSRVTLRGERFGGDQGAVQVTLGTTAVRLVSVAPTEIVVLLPPTGTTGRFNVTVAGIGPVQSPADFSVLEAVGVSGFAPRAGDAGDHVTPTGTGFSPTADQNIVHLGATLTARVISSNPRELIVEVPEGARSGQWSVAVTGNGSARARDPFMVTQRPRILALEPDSGVVGTRITLRGQNFPSDRPLVQVRLQDIECNVESTSREAIVVAVPGGVQPGPARFTVIARLQGTGHAPMDFHVLVPTRITGLDPAGAPVGAHVTIRGEGFETDTHALVVRLNATALRVVSVSTTSIEFVVPRGALSGPITVEAPQRQSATANFTVQVPPVVQAVAA
ncbi:MAG: IPT/TIG domain-containing protein, partial [Deltaproteobacteria bacterium]